MKDKVLICKNCSTQVKNVKTEQEIFELGKKIHSMNRTFLIAERKVFNISNIIEKREDINDWLNKIKLKFDVGFPADISSYRHPNDSKDDVIYVGTVQDIAKPKKRVTTRDPTRYNSIVSQTSITDHDSDITFIGEFKLPQN